jgi:hypothetical protein
MEAVRSNGGAAGVDAETIQASNNEGQESFWRRFQQRCGQADIVLPR